MKKFLYLILCLSALKLNANDQFSNHSGTDRLQSYLQFLKTFDETLGPCGNHNNGEIEVLLNPDEISEVEALQQKRLLKRGLSLKEAQQMSQCGIIQSDTYWIWVRDAVIFPSGHKGTYNRVIWRSAVDGPGNVAILPILKDGRIVMNLNYRHSTRAFEVEIPRGSRLYGETPERACRRELRAETGCLTERQVYLGSITPDTSTVTTITPVFLGYVSEQIDNQQEPSEAILGLLTLNKEEVKEAFVRGFIEVEVKGKVQKVSFRDSYLAFALLQAEARGLI